MKRRVDLEKAGEGEIFGALAVGPRRHRSVQDTGEVLTSAQKRAVADLAHSLIEVARNAGAAGKSISIGDVFLELRQNGVEEVLSIRKLLAS